MRILALVLFCLALVSLRVNAQSATRVTTNQFLAPAIFREVEGKLYNTQLAERWRVIGDEFRIWRRTNDEVILEKQPSRVPVAYVPRPYVDSLARIGGLAQAGAYESPPEPRPGPSRAFLLDGDFIVIRNGPPETRVTGYVSVVAMNLGVTNYFDERVFLYDCGTPHYVLYLTTNRVEGAKAK
jgi:hypothetical protein